MQIVKIRNTIRTSRCHWPGGPDRNELPQYNAHWQGGQPTVVNGVHLAIMVVGAAGLALKDHGRGRTLKGLAATGVMAARQTEGVRCHAQADRGMRHSKVPITRSGHAS